MGASDPKSRADEHRPSFSVETEPGARRGAELGSHDVDRLIDMLARTDVDSGERLSRALSSLARWAAETEPQPISGAAALIVHEVSGELEPQPRPSARKGRREAPDSPAEEAAGAPSELEPQSEPEPMHVAAGSELIDSAPALGDAAPAPTDSKPTQSDSAPVAAGAPPIASLRAALAEIAARQKALDEEEDLSREPKPTAAEPLRQSEPGRRTRRKIAPGEQQERSGKSAQTSAEPPPQSEQARPTDRARPAPSQPVSPEAISELRVELDSLARSVADLPTRVEIDRLTREMTTLATKLGSNTPARLDAESLKAIDALVVEVDRMRSDAASPQAISNLSEEVQAISARLEVIGPRNASAIDTLARRIEDVKSELDQFPRISAVDDVAAEIKSIIVRLETQEQAASPIREEVVGLAGRMEALDGQIVAMATAAIARDDAFEQINATIKAELGSLPRADAVTDLGRQINALTEDLKSRSAIEPVLQALDGKIVAMATAAIARDDAFEQIKAELGSLPRANVMTDLGRQIDALTEGLKNRSAIGPALQAVEGLAGKVDALDGKFSAVRPDVFDNLGRQIATLTASLSTIRSDEGAVVAAISGKLDMLGERMETITAATHARGDAFERIEDSVRAIADQLVNSGLPVVAGATLQGEASRLLERLEAGDSRIDELHLAFEGLAARIERSCSELGANVADNAVSAARERLGAEVGGGRFESELSQALTEMRASSAQSERRAAEALDAVRAALEKLLDRMEQGGGSAIAIEAHHAVHAAAPHAFEPISHTARDEPSARVTDAPPPAAADDARFSASVAKFEAGETASAARTPELNPDHPLEPGVRPAFGGQQTAASFIAAARRAASLPFAEPVAAPTDTAPSDRPSLVSGAITSLKSRRRPLMFGLVAALVVFAALYVASGMTGETVEESPPPAPQSSVAPNQEPKVAAGIDLGSIEVSPDASETARPGSEMDNLLAPDERAVQAAIPSEYADTIPGAAAPAADGPPATKTAASAPAPGSAFAFNGNPGSTSRGAEWQAGEPVTTGSIQRTSAGELPEEIGGPLLRSRALSGDASAQLEVADRLLEGHRLEANPAAASKWLEKAAAQGLAPAQHRLGSLYEKGRGVARDIPAARRWYEQAAEAGNVRAMHNLGVIHAEGGLGKPDYNAAVVWFRKSAERGLVDSQYNIAVLCARGLGGKRDLVEAYKWFALAADQGDKDAGLKRDEVAKVIGPSLSIAKAQVVAFRARSVDAAANDAAEPAGGWDKVAEHRDEKSVAR